MYKKIEDIVCPHCGEKMASYQGRDEGKCRFWCWGCEKFFSVDESLVDHSIKNFPPQPEEPPVKAYYMDNEEIAYVYPEDENYDYMDWYIP